MIHPNRLTLKISQCQVPTQATSWWRLYPTLYTYKYPIDQFSLSHTLKLKEKGRKEKKGGKEKKEEAQSRRKKEAERIRSKGKERKSH